jgi:ELWxxDGT repeat protein
MSRRVIGKIHRAVIESLEARRMLTASLVKDVNASGSASGNPSWITPMGEDVYFAANDGAHGNELWRSDGTTAGTTMVTDIVSGTGNSNPRNLVVIGDTLFFVASDSSGASKIWKTDGTSYGTVAISVSCDPMQLTAVGGALFFTGTDAQHGRELWKSDGTVGGTGLAVELWTGPTSGFDGSEPFAAAGNKLFFNRNGGIYASDGTPAGTVLLPDTDGFYPTNSASIGDKFYYYREVSNTDTGFNDEQIWSSDGTVEGTTQVIDIGGYGAAIVSPINFDGTLVFCYYEGSGDTETIYQYDPNVGGSPQSLTQVTGVAGFYPADDGNLYFDGTALDGTVGLYKYDRKTNSTALLLGHPYYQPISTVAKTGRGIFFVAYDASHGSELWFSDGTATGTVRTDIYAGGGELFAGQHGRHGRSVVLHGKRRLARSRVVECGP